MLILGFVLYASTAVLPLFLQTLLGYTAMLSGMVLSPGGIAILLCMPFVGRLVRKYEARWLIIFGILVSAYGLYRMSKFTLGLDFQTAMWTRVVQSAGLAFLFVPISTAAFALIPKERTNYATGLFNLARNVGGSSGIAAVTTLLARRTQFHQSVLVSHMTPYDPPYQQALARATAMFRAAGASPADAAARAQATLYGTLQRQASMLGFADAFWLMAVLFLGVIPLMFFMKRAKPPAEIPAGH
jgi:DHA2 family multidrug resistance protein